MATCTKCNQEKEDVKECGHCAECCDCEKTEAPVAEEAKVEEIFFPIMPDFPVPEITIFPFLQFKIVLTAFSKVTFMFFLSFLKDVISVSITFLAIVLNFFNFIFI